MITEPFFSSGGEAAAERAVSGVGGGAPSLSACRHQSGETQPRPGCDGAKEEVAGGSEQGETATSDIATLTMTGLRPHHSDWLLPVSGGGVGGRCQEADEGEGGAPTGAAGARGAGLCHSAGRDLQTESPEPGAPTPGTVQVQLGGGVCSRFLKLIGRCLLSSQSCRWKM